MFLTLLETKAHHHNKRMTKQECRLRMFSLHTPSSMLADPQSCSLYSGHVTFALLIKQTFEIQNKHKHSSF